MINDYRYKLERGSKKHYCPSCNKKRFVRFVDTQNNNSYLPIEFGFCDRKDKCGYSLKPSSRGYSKENHSFKSNKVFTSEIKIKKTPTVLEFIPFEIYSKQLTDYKKNKFIQNLLTNIKFPFTSDRVNKVIELYYLGTVSKSGAICFPFIDTNGNIRAVQEKIFNAENKTDKTRKYHTGWIHKRLEFTTYKNGVKPDWLKNYLNLELKVSCLFGEHLLSKYPNNPIALVESPKNAILGTLYFGFPDNSNNLLWLSVSNLTSLKTDRCKSLTGRKIILFPDLSKSGNAFNSWSEQAKKMENEIPNTTFAVSDFLEKFASDKSKEKGKDIADYLIQFDWQNFEKPKKEEDKTIKDINQNKETEVLITQNNFNWDSEIEMLDSFFKKTKMPTDKVEIHKGNIIRDCSNFIENHLITVKANNGKKTFEPYIDRLKELKYKLSKID